jgi:hypothetical protein
MLFEISLPVFPSLIPIENAISQNRIDALPNEFWPLYRTISLTPLVFSFGIALLGFMLMRVIFTLRILPNPPLTAVL